MTQHNAGDNQRGLALQTSVHASCVPNHPYAGGKDYSRGTNFQCLATTGDGCVAIGSRDGKVRLYSPTSLQRAVTAVSSLGATITAIDVTYDGHYVLATTDRYLMVIPTKTSNSRTGAASTGFRHNMGKDKLPPKLLRLHLSDVELTVSKRKLRPLNFRHFTRGSVGRSPSDCTLSRRLYKAAQNANEKCQLALAVSFLSVIRQDCMRMCRPRMVVQVSLHSCWL